MALLGMALGSLFGGVSAFDRTETVQQNLLSIMTTSIVKYGASQNVSCINTSGTNQNGDVIIDGSTFHDVTIGQSAVVQVNAQCLINLSSNSTQVNKVKNDITQQLAAPAIGGGASSGFSIGSYSKTVQDNTTSLVNKLITTTFVEQVAHALGTAISNQSSKVIITNSNFYNVDISQFISMQANFKTIMDLVSRSDQSNDFQAVVSQIAEERASAWNSAIWIVVGVSVALFLIIGYFAWTYFKPSTSINFLTPSAPPAAEPNQQQRVRFKV